MSDLDRPPIVREPSSTSSSHESFGYGPMADHVERELRGYLAALEEGLPVLEPRSCLIAAVVIGQIARCLVQTATARAWRPWCIPRGAQGRNRVGASSPPLGDAAILRLRFARYLFNHSHISG